MGERYDFTDVWTIPASIEFAWRMVDDVAGWPRWWPDYRFAEIVSDVSHGPGTRWHVRVKSDLPYTVDFEFTVLEHEPPTYVRTSVGGFFEGTIDWRLEKDGSERDQADAARRDRDQVGVDQPHRPDRRAAAPDAKPRIRDAPG